MRTHWLTPHPIQTKVLFAGPILRIVEALDPMGAGDRGHPILLRSKDDLKGIADRINRRVHQGASV